jgi:hypothetical protein
MIKKLLYIKKTINFILNNKALYRFYKKVVFAVVN